MDMKNIIERIKQIESRQTLMEDSQPSQPVKVQPQSQPVQRKTTAPDSIYSTLIREFGLDLNEANPWEGKDPAKAAAWAKLSPEDQKWLGMADPTDDIILARAPSKGGFLGSLGLGKKPQAQAAAPAAAPAQAPTPAPGTVTSSNGQPVVSGTGTPVQSGTATQTASGGAAKPAAPAPAGTPAGSVDDEGNIMPGYTTDEQGNVVKAGNPNFVEPATQKLAQQGRQAAKEKEFAASADRADAEMGQAMAANAAGGPSSVNAQGQNVTMPDGTNPETGQKTQTATAQATTPADTSPLQLPPGSAPETGYTVAGGTPPAGGAAKPAASKSDPKVKALQDKLIAAGAKIKADGIMGPQTQAAMKQFPNAVSGNLPLAQGTKPSTAGAGRGGQGGPTAAELAAYQASQNQSPAETARLARAGKPPAPATTAAPGAGQKGPTKAAAAGQDPSNPLNKPAGGAAAPAGTTNTTSQQNVSGTLKMGRPSGPIQFNGQTVNPGDPQYAAASQALLKSQGQIQQARTQMTAPRGAPSTAPVQMGATNADRADFEESRALSRIKQLAGL
jgi:hypothetical protein